MNCSSFETEAQRLLDERTVELPRDMRGHLATCDECRAFWQGQLWLLDAVQSAAAEDLPSGLTQSVLDRIFLATADVRRGAPSSWGMTAALCSTAALALVAISLARWTVPVDRQPVAVVHRSASLIPAAEPLLASQSLSRLWDGVHAEYQQLSQETTQTLDGFAELPRPSGILPILSPLESSPPGPSETWLRVDRPISERVEAAFDFLWDALPSDNSHSS